MLSKAMTYYIPKGHRHKKTRISVLGGRTNRFYHSDKENYWNVYLRSDHWKHLRWNKLILTPKCEKCESDIHLDVHHLVYKNLYDVDVSDLMTLCRKCHNGLHQEQKRKEIETYRKINKRRKQRYERKFSKRSHQRRATGF